MRIRRTPVLILGPHIAALGVLRVLARRRIPAYVVDDTTNVIVRSRWYRRPERTLAETSDPAVLDEYLKSLRLPRAILIACSDRWAQAVAGLPAETRERFPASIAPAEAIAHFVDKDRFRALVARLDLPRPRTIPIGSAADLDHVSDEDLLNGFLKPTESQRHNQRFHNKGFFIESRAHAVRLVEEATRAGITFMLQEWIPGDPSKTYLIDGFVDGSGRIATMIARRRIRMDPPRLANTCSDVTVPLADVEACIPTLQTLFEAVDYRGIFNVEFKLDERDGQFKIIEVNPRPFWLIGHIAAAGVDLPWMAYLDAQGVAVAAPPSHHVGWGCTRSRTRPPSREPSSAAADLAAQSAPCGSTATVPSSGGATHSPQRSASARSSLAGWPACASGTAALLPPQDLRRAQRHRARATNLALRSPRSHGSRSLTR